VNFIAQATGVSAVVIASDNFTRANSPTLGPNWTTTTDNNEPLAILNNLAVTNASAGIGGDNYTGKSFQNDQFASITIQMFGINSELDLSIRENISQTLGYQAGVTGGNDGTYQYTIVDLSLDAFIGVTVTTSVAPVPGDIFSFQVVGTLLTMFYNGVPVVSGTASTAASGAPGLFIGDTTSQADTSVSLFTAGSMTTSLHYSEPDCRNFGQFPNTAVNVNGTLTYTTPTHPSVTPPVDSRVNKPVASGTYPQNSRTPGVYGPNN